MFPADDNENQQQQLLSHESRKSIELCTKIRKQFQQAVLDGHREQQVMTVVDLMEEMQHGWRATSGENAQLREQNGRLKRQIENFEKALAEARVKNQRLNSQHAADQELIAALQLELEQYKERFNRARLELQNAELEGKPSNQKKKVIPDEDTKNDDENGFFAQQPTNGVKDGLETVGGNHVRRRRSNSVGVLSDKGLMEKQQQLHLPSPFPLNPPKLLLGPLFVSSSNSYSTNRMPIQIQKSSPPQSKQMHQNNQMTPVSTRTRHRIPVRICGGTSTRRRGVGRENGQEDDDEDLYPPPSSEPHGKNFKYRLTPYSPASSIRHQHRNNNNKASPIPINLSTGFATLPPLSSSKQPMKTIMTTMGNGAPAALLPPLVPSNLTKNLAGGITLDPFLSNGGQQTARQKEEEQQQSDEQYLAPIRLNLPAQWKPTLGKLY